MARRATRERLAKDAERFGLVAMAKRRLPVRFACCEQCGRVIGAHSVQQLFACGKKQRGLTP